MSLPEAAATLAGCLLDSAPLWREVPFHDDPRWVGRHPALVDTLLALPDSRVDALDDDAVALAEFIAPFVPALRPLIRAADDCIDAGPPPTLLPARESDARDVPGRKWSQIRHFASSMGEPAGPVIEWCSGKAHLGRLLARVHGCHVTSVEKDFGLCAEGNRLAAREHLPVQLIERDVLTIEAGEAWLVRDAHAVALHACGDLHVALMQVGSEAGVAAFDIAPCCYHLTRSTAWQPMSQALRVHTVAGLEIPREELRLAVQETKTAAARVVTAQRTLAAWRLGFDRLQRELRGVDAYLPTPSRPARVIAEGFPAFCASLAAHHGIRLPTGLDWERFRQAGQERLARVRRLELLRHAFRRPLEVLLVADRALWLADQGYDVQVRTFCPRRLTPRNLLIQARRASAIRGHEPHGGLDLGC